MTDLPSLEKRIEGATGRAVRTSTNKGLSKPQLAGLEYMSRTSVRGPAPGWNASVWIEDICDGEDIAALFDLGLIVARPIPPPHVEQFDEDAGSITNDHEYHLTAAGVATLNTQQTR